MWQNIYCYHKIDAVHKGKKPFKCDICDYRSPQKCHLNRHIASIHEGKKPFRCDICDYGCSQKSDLTDTWHQFMNERSPSSVTFVTTAVLEIIP